MNNYYKILCLIIFSIIALLIPYSVYAQSSYNSYFNMSESQFDNITPFSKWTGVIKRFEKQSAVPDSKCGITRYHPCSVKMWKKFLKTLQGKSFDDKLNEVNKWGNKHPYIIDQLNWGLNDYWETPYEFMEISGDCEDYAISKYYSLRALGIPESRLRIIVLQDLNLGGIIHAVLGVYNDDGDLFVLDNQIKKVIPALKIYHYRPIYGINETNWWTYSPKM